MKKIIAIISLSILTISSIFSVTTGMITDNATLEVQAVQNDLNQKRDVTKGVVIHNDAGSISGRQYRYLESYSENQLARGFAHYYVAKGDVYQFWDDSKVAWHTGNFSGNTEYIGVEVTNSYGLESRFLANEQESFKLVAKLLTKYGLKPNRETIRLHKEFSPTACPHRSWVLHGGSINSVKDYFISQVKKYMSDTTESENYSMQIGQTVQLVSIAGLAIDNSQITEADRRLVGTVVNRAVMTHRGNGQKFPSYTVKWSNGKVQSYVYFDLQPSSEEVYKLKINQSVKLVPSAGLAIDNSTITQKDKNLTGTIINRAMMKHQGNGQYFPSYTVKWSNGKVQSYVYFDLEANNQSQNKPNTESTQNTESAGKEPILLYAAHGQNYGWLNAVSNGQTAGTTGRSLRMEALKISLENISGNSGVTYGAHIQQYGWLNSVINRQEAGTTGRSLRMEALYIKLTGDIATKYDVYYRAHIQNYGWLGWTKNGQNAGSAGRWLRMEAVEIKLVKKGSANAPELGQAFL